ncbi:amidohydrolase family protein [Marinicella rhabdoformis]|uniref:amidohydrolase family protein n=1 Tax=Marinicella rhabdoformis TaxID=2580566 RepID=UPI0015D05078|nr:amidohydrolase family protein [Marinicella rhabdoformis]
MHKVSQLALLTAAIFASQPSQANALPTATINGIADERSPVMALTHATIHVNSTTVLEDATLVIQGDRILSVSDDNKYPQNAQVKDYTGMHLYPGFILLDSHVGMPEMDKKPPFRWGKKETIQSTKKGAYNANEAIKASFSAADVFTADAKSNKTLRSNGFTNALTYQPDGIMRGTSALVHLNEDSAHQAIIRREVAQHMSFDKGSSKQDFPVSLMGAVALIRQTLMDADWYKQQNEMIDLDLQAINDNSKLPRIINADNWQQTVLSKKIGTEFDVNFIVKTAGDSYQDVVAVSETGQPLIVPLVQEKAPAVNDELDLWNVDYEDLKKWQLTPFNPAILAREGVNFALIPAPKKEKSFLKDLKNAVKHGLDKQIALASITSTPAKLIGDGRLGQLKKGSFANFVVTTDGLFMKGSEVAETWVAGDANQVAGMPRINNGAYQLTIDEQVHDVKVSNKGGKISLAAADKDNKTKYKVTQDNDFITINVTLPADEDSKEAADEHKLFGVINNKQIDALKGNWSLTASSADDQAEESKAAETKAIPSIPRPFSAYGLAQVDKNNNILITNATVWTNEADGILENTDVLVKNGKIQSLGKGLKAGKGVKTIDGTGKHLTSGIVDEHTHIALLSVNDIAVNSAMVRMEDAVDSHDINIYRNLAGGVTAAQLLHGSANPIGGQSALIKLKWGVDADEMLIDGADGYIKFALGENVKRSSSNESIRYPLTRMGVEQVYRDQFTQAKAYEQAWKDYNSLSSSKKKKTTAPRKDLALETLVEIMNKDRFVSCHSYVQSEINMLMHVAEDFDFNINTFTHILEGYKVADKMKAHGVGGSTFSDWWAYKWEVNYAIPYNANIMHNAGVVTAINSDSAEMSRRLNQEAAKSVKYGGMSEEDAWKLVTLNPAKLLHLNDRMGSVKTGKDADLVLWSDNPLSIYARAEKTMIDGVIYYDRDKQADIEAEIDKEKMALVKLSKNDKGPKKPFKSMPKQLMHCDTLTGLEHNERHQFLGE